jgi:hypothetical protein
LIAVPWDQANRKHTIRAVLVTEDGEHIEIGGNPIMLEAGFEVGRPPGLKAGTPLNTPLVFNAGGIMLDVGGYVWELHVNGQLEARAPFRVVSPTGQ